MSNIRYRIYLRDFSEYCYGVLTNLNADQKSKLSVEDLKILETKTKTSIFTSEETLDRLLLMLTKVGYRVFLTVANSQEDKENFETMCDIHFEYPQQQVDAAEFAGKKRVFSISSEDIMFSMMLANQNIHSKVYKLATNSRDLARKTSSIKSTKLPPSEQMQQAEDGYQNMNAILLQQLNSFSWVVETLGLKQDELRCLVLLFTKRTSAMNVRDIEKGMMLEIRESYVGKILQALKEMKLIAGDAKKGKKAKASTYYMITAEGIRKVMEYNNHIYKLTFGV